MNIHITKTQFPKVKPDEKALGFGKYFSDHMFIMNYDEGNIMRHLTAVWML